MAPLVAAEPLHPPSFCPGAAWKWTHSIRRLIPRQGQKGLGAYKVYNLSDRCTNHLRELCILQQPINYIWQLMADAPRYDGSVVKLVMCFGDSNITSTNHLREWCEL